MTNHMPLNGPRVTSTVNRALSGQRSASAASSLGAALAGDAANDTADHPEGAPVQRSAPDGTNGATKTYATDPSQGMGASAKKRRSSNRDPLLEGLMGLRSMNTRSRF